MKFQSSILHVAAALAFANIGAVAIAQSAAEASGPAKSILLHPGDADGAFINARQFSEPDGERLYRRVCAGCHMPDAKGAQGAGIYPALAANANLASGDYAVVVVMKGLHGMPGVGRMMSDEQVADVVNYVRTHFGNSYRDKVTPAQVESVR